MVEIDIFNDPAKNNWWKRKLAALGYTHKPVNLYKLEAQCPMCGHGAYLFPINGTFDMCQPCFKRLHNYEGIGGRVMFSSTLSGTQCRKCLTKNFVYVHINQGRLCTKCIWSVLGGKKIRLKTPDGDRVG